MFILLSVPAAAQFVCGGHRVDGSAVRMAADVDRGTLLSQPGWFTACDRALWDQLIYNAFDNFKTNAGPLEQRRTLVVAPGTVPTITVCVESADQSYTGERLAPFADEQWWREHIGHWTGLRWRGELQIGRECSTALFRKIEVREGDPDDLGITRSPGRTAADPADGGCGLRSCSIPIICGRSTTGRCRGHWRTNSVMRWVSGTSSRVSDS